MAPRPDCSLCLSPADDALCRACRNALPWLGAACERCAVSLPQPGLCGQCLRRPPLFAATCAAFEYRFPLDRLVQRFKYGGDLALGRWLALRLAERVRDEPRPDVLVAPPVSIGRLRERGFNQALEIAKIVAAQADLHWERAALARSRDTPSQAGLSKRERLSNLRGAFECRRSFEGAHVGIVDDVMTTGATAEAMATALEQAGARRVVVWTVARAPEPKDD